MEKLDINRIHIIATEWENCEPYDRIYVVAKTPDGKYDDPNTCIVDLADNYVGAPQPMHQFYKHCYPVPLEVTKIRMLALNEQILSLPITYQLMLIQLYDTDYYKSTEPIVSKDAFEYVTTRMLLPLSEEEFDNIEIGFRLHLKYSEHQEPEEFIWAADHYLTSMENPMDRKKMKRVVELILEYLEGIGQWQKNYPF